LRNKFVGVKMKKVNLNDDIELLNIDEPIIKILKKHNVLIVEQLWNLKRNDLKEMGFESLEIKHIKIKMQLHSLDINRKKYNKN